MGVGGLRANRVSENSHGTMSRSWMRTEGEHPSGIVVLGEWEGGGGREWEGEGEGGGGRGWEG